MNMQRSTPLISSIQIGQPNAFKLVHALGNYAVFALERGPGEPNIYVIGRLPHVTERGFQPGSALKEFSSAASAIQALKRWALDPLPPAPTPKVRGLGSGIGAAQRELNLGHSQAQTKTLSPEQLAALALEASELLQAAAERVTRGELTPPYGKN
jgi:hypothetical protein